MGINEVTITRAIVERYVSKFLGCLELDVAIVGGGPSGLVAGYFLAKAGKKTALFERKVGLGGGIWGGGMLFNEIVVQEDALSLFDLFGIRWQKYDGIHFTADSIEVASSLIAGSVKAGVRVFNAVSAEDVMIRENRVAGLVINWSPVEMAGLHVDPLTIMSKFVIDATGHATEVVRVVEAKVPGKLNTQSGKIEGEKSMWADRAESLTLSNTKEVFPGLYVAGMAANATFGGPRMGPIFGGMLLSGKKAAEEILTKLSEAS